MPTKEALQHQLQTVEDQIEGLATQVRLAENRADRKEADNIALTRANEGLKGQLEGIKYVLTEFNRLSRAGRYEDD